MSCSITIRQSNVYLKITHTHIYIRLVCVISVHTEALIVAVSSIQYNIPVPTDFTSHQSESESVCSLYSESYNSFCLICLITVELLQFYCL
jgi:hypothetical protein